MKYQTIDKIKGESGFNGFELKGGNVYIIYRLNLVSNILYKAKRHNLNAYHFKVTSSDKKGSGSKVAEIHKKYYSKNTFIYLDCISQNENYELFIFSNSTLLEIESILNNVYVNYELISKYDLHNYDEEILLINQCFNFCTDNTSSVLGRRFIKASQLSKLERQCYIYREPRVVLRRVA